MIGLKKFPKEKDLKQAYEILGGLRDLFPTNKNLSLYVQWSRLDPRLAEILVRWFIKNWQKINPLHFNDEIKKSFAVMQKLLLRDTRFFYAVTNVKSSTVIILFSAIKAARSIIAFNSRTLPGHA